jgi:hypothetical protein
MSHVVPASHAGPRGRPRPMALALLLGAALLGSPLSPAFASTATDARALRAATALAEARGAVRLPGLLRHYLRLVKQAPPEEGVDAQPSDGGAPTSLAVVLPEVLATVARLRDSAPSNLAGPLDKAHARFAQALQALHTGGSGGSPAFMAVVLQDVATAQTAMDQALDLAAVIDPPAVALLLPAVQAAREAARRHPQGLIDLALKAGVTAGRIDPAQQAAARADALAAAGDFVGAGQQDAEAFGLAAATLTFSMDRFEQNLRSVFDPNTVGWAYALSQGGQLARSDAHGQARTGADQPPLDQSPTKKMHVASVSKTLTALLVLRRLHEMGLTEDAEIGPWLPSGWARGVNVDTLSFADLMQHRSGFGQNANGGNTYARLQAMVATDVPPSSPHDYYNANFGLMRVLLARMLGFDPSVLPVDPAVLSSALFLAYADLVYDSVGVPFSCEPQAQNPTLQYRFPDSGNPGYAEPSQALACGGYGVQISATNLARTMAALRYTTDLLPADRFQAMKSRYLGLRNPQDIGYAEGVFGVYAAHGGDWDHSGGAGEGGLDACVMMFPIHVEAALTINSSRKGTGVGDYPNGSQCYVLRWAFENAWVAP